MTEWKGNPKLKILLTVISLIVLFTGLFSYRYLDSHLPLYRLGISVWHKDRKTFLKYVALPKIIAQVINYTRRDINHTYSQGTQDKNWSKVELELGRGLFRNTSKTIRRAVQKSIVFEICTNLYKRKHSIGGKKIPPPKDRLSGLIRDLRIFFRVVSALRKVSFQRIDPIRAKIKIKRTEVLGGESPYLGNRRVLTFRLKKKSFGYWKIIGLEF